MGTVEWLIVILLVAAIIVVFTLIFRLRTRKIQPPSDLVTKPSSADIRAQNKPEAHEIQKAKPQADNIGYKGKNDEINIPREKRLVIAYLFLLPLGFFGGHRFYLNKYLTGFLFVVGLIVAFITIVSSLESQWPGGESGEQPFYGTVFMIATVAWLIAFVVDAFRIPSMTRAVNRKLWEDWYKRQSAHDTQISGTVRDLVKSSGDTFGGKVAIPKQVLRFRIQETDGRLVQVEIFGNVITGDIHDGELVQIRGKLSQGNIMHALEIENRTTNSLLKVAF